MQILEQLCAIPATSGDETKVRDHLIEFFQTQTTSWKQQPQLFFGSGFQDNLLVVFGQPKIAFYAHMDTVGYTMRYDNYVVPVGGTDGQTGNILVYEKEGKILETKLIQDDLRDLTLVDAAHTIAPGTTLTYKPNFQLEGDFLSSPYLDNRLAIWALLQIAPTLENAAFAFTTYEEHGGGAAGLLARKLFESYGTVESIITDITWATHGVFLGKGPAISLRDSRIPRKTFVDQILAKVKEGGLSVQLEVEYQGGSDGREIQHLPYPIDWIFIGPPSENQHSALERVHMRDVDGFIAILKLLAS